MKSNILKWANEADGSFKRQSSAFRDVIGDEKFLAEKDRYHLYVSLACPWAHRTLIVRKLKGLEELIPVSIVDWLLEEGGWKFSSPEPLYGYTHLSQLYHKADSNYSGRYTVPVLWDKKHGTIVNNESSDIIRIFNHSFNNFIKDKFKSVDFYPEAHRKEINDLNDWIYNDLNNGVYKAGFATEQKPYEEAALKVHSSLLKVESILSKQKYMLGDGLTEVDIRLFTTILRFDPVYFGHFKCNLLAVKDCPNIIRWAEEIYAMVEDTCDMHHIKNHYYQSHKQINPTGIVPLSNGPITLN